ncbi:MAG: SpoVR family protein [Candidatus Sungbacteria bacterium]|nr:SpoVR family protein [Candidatus Sungbacteria bacterium]
MELLSQSMKGEMEACKRRAREAGLVFQDNTLEYVVTNQDMLELSPRVMIPTLYDYWAFDVEVHQNRWMYDIHPHNPYETVINTRPPISFYNQDNADWFNVMIFYHVLGHIDFFQNNTFFRRTWDDDFCGQALADKRLINRIRAEHGDQKRWVDYLIEFARAIDNLVGYHQELKEGDEAEQPEIFGAFSEKADFYFGQFLKELYEAKRVKLEFYYEEIERYNRCVRTFGKKQGELAFFEDNTFRSKLPEFNDVFKKRKEKGEKPKPKDIFEHLAERSDSLNQEENRWMKEVLQVIRRTSLYFQPQMRTKIANEGWASLWHQTLFMADERMSTHEVDFARVDSAVTFDPRLGINPYAAGKHLFEFIEALARKGRLSPEYRLLKNIDTRKKYDRDCGQAAGRKALFEARRHFDDYLLVNFLSDEDFQDFVDEHKLFIAGVRPSRERWDRAEIYIKSRSGKEYRRLLNRMLYHPPYVDFSGAKAKDGELYLDHVYEGRSLFRKYIGPVLIGLEFLWGRQVKLETTEYEETQPKNWWEWRSSQYQPEYKKIRVLYACDKRKITRTILDQTTTDSYGG